MKISTALLCVLMTSFLNGCGKEDDQNPTNTSSSSSNSSSSSGGGVVLAEFSSHALGAYPLLTNVKLDEAVSTYPLVAALPELVKLEKKDELQDYIKSSQALGFDKEQFDVLYQATFEMITALRLTLMSDIQGINRDGENTSDFKWPSLDLKPFIADDINIEYVIDSGSKGKNRSFTYSINQSYSLPNCTEGPATCDINIDIDITFKFPEKNPGIDLATSFIAVSLAEMHINISRFVLSNSSASLNLNPKQNNQLTLSHGLVITTIPGAQLLDVESWDIYSNNLLGNAFDLSNFTGTFTNTYSDDNGDTQEVRITGTVNGKIEDFNFRVNYIDKSNDKDTYIVDFEEANNIENRSTFSENTMSGFINGTDLSVHFVTE